jgi:selenide,water dikinase
LSSPDDAAVWRLDDQRALVMTTDFFTPVVDDPYDYGAIAAANSLSDVYAMGGTPFLALNLAALPTDLPAEISAEILRGGAEMARRAGVVIAGGHTVQDREPKYGLVVLGMVDPANLITKAGAQPGDKLVLTKPLGFGMVTTALKRQAVDPQDLAEAVGWMTRLNDKAGKLAAELGVRGGTDVTGFALLGHAWEMAAASGVGLRFEFHKIPFLKNARRYAEARIFPGGAFDNCHYYSPHVTFASGVDEASQMMLFDPQTSGGLLLAVAAEKLEPFIDRAAVLEQPVWLVGEVTGPVGIEVTA